MSRDGVLPAMVVAAICMVLAPCASGAISFQWLPSEIDSVSAISGDGTTVLAYVSGTPMLWHTDQGFLPLPVDVPAGYRLNVMSSDASVFGGYVLSPTGQDPAWTGNGSTGESAHIGPVVIGPAGEYFTRISGIAADGATAIGYSREAGTVGEQKVAHAFRWNSTGGLALLEGLSPVMPTEARGVSADGLITVGVSGTAWTLDSRPVRWLGDGSIELLFDHAALALRVSGDGSIITGVIYGVSEPPPIGETSLDTFVWSEHGGLQVLDPVPGQFNLIPVAISGDGSTIIGFSHVYVNGYVESRSFIWSSQLGMHDVSTLLAVSGAGVPSDAIVDVIGISSDGQIINGSIWDSDRSNYWIIAIPEPATIWLIAGTLLITSRRGRRRVGRE